MCATFLALCATFLARETFAANFNHLDNFNYFYMSTTYFEGAEHKKANFSTLRITQKLWDHVCPTSWGVLNIPAHRRRSRPLSSLLVNLWSFLCFFRILYAPGSVRRIKLDKWPTIFGSDIFPHSFKNYVRHFLPRRTQSSNFDRFFGNYICLPHVSKALISKMLISTRWE